MKLVKLVADLWKSLRREEQSRCQKSRINWLREDDKNTTFFQNIANGRRRRNLITELLSEDNIISNHSSIRIEVQRYFKKHFQKMPWQRPKIPWIGIKKWTDEERVALEEPFNLEEVWIALSNCEGNKAPGPDGFTLNFIKAQWMEIRGDFMNFINDFHKGVRNKRD